jgi:hypothetical protein
MTSSLVDCATLWLTPMPSPEHVLTLRQGRGPIDLSTFRLLHGSSRDPEKITISITRPQSLPDRVPCPGRAAWAGSWENNLQPHACHPLLTPGTCMGKC